MSIAAGDGFTCAQVSPDQFARDVVCWGDNREGQLGVRSDDGPCGGAPCSPVPLVVDQDVLWAPGIAAGAEHACGRRDGGDRTFAQCWGANDGGQLAQFDTETYDGPVDVVWPGDVVDALGLGADFTCLAQTNSPVLECYGRSDRGQLAEFAFQEQPPALVGLTSGRAHTCGWTASGVVSCWGDNGAFQLGSETVAFQSQLLPVEGLRLSEVAAGAVHNCGRDEDGAVWCWGDNRWGQLGRGDPILRLAPTEIDDVEGGWLQFAGAAGHACGLADGALYCWGDSVEGEIGRPEGDPSTNPTPVFDPAPSRVDKVAVGGRSSCALTSMGEVRCWGSNACGQLAVPLDVASRFQPAAVVAPDLPLFADIAVGARHVCAVARDETVWCWGSNGEGQLGVREVGEEACDGSDYTPAALPTFFGASAVAAGLTHTCANVGGVIWCWGDNGDGQLGSSPGRDGAPAVVGDLAADVDQLVCGGAHCCVRHATGTLSCWGDNSYGQLGAEGGEGGAPVIVRALTDVTWVTAGRGHTCAVAAGRLWCWGRNQFGQVGDGTQVDRDGPRPVGP
jgi:alpha-tubulin suppressor-like RCC1 family protein